MHQVLLQQQRAGEGEAAAAAAVVGAGQMHVWLDAVEGVQRVCVVL